VYTVKFAEAVFLLHCFQNKSKRGIATPRQDIEIKVRPAKAEVGHLMFAAA
jgi:phage-related protein